MDKQNKNITGALNPQPFYILQHICDSLKRKSQHMESNLQQKKDYIF